MIEISPDNTSSTYVIRAYQPGSLLINDLTLTVPLIIMPHQLIYPWQPDNFSALINLNPEVVLLGTGDAWTMLSAENLMLFYQKNIGIESMDTRAACRTFNVLAAEGRNIAAGLIV